MDIIDMDQQQTFGSSSTTTTIMMNDNSNVLTFMTIDLQCCCSNDKNVMIDNIVNDYGQAEEDYDNDNDDDDDEEQEDRKDPFSPKYRIPLPNFCDLNDNFNDDDDGNRQQKDYLRQQPNYFNNNNTKTFIKRRNERERTRVRNVNDGFERLRLHLPLSSEQREKRLSKVETLRLAISYIKYLEDILKS